MSTGATTTHTGTAGAGHAAGARAAHLAGRKPGAPGHGQGADHFSLLLSLLGTSGDLSGLPLMSDPRDSGGASNTLSGDTLTTDAQATGADGSHLAAVMQWMDLPQGHGVRHKAQAAAAPGTEDDDLRSPGTRRAGGAGPQTKAGDLALASAPDAPRGQALPEGMQQLDQPEALDEATLAALARQAEGGGAGESAVATSPSAAPDLVRATGASAGHGRSLHPHAAAGAHAQISQGNATTQVIQQQAQSVQNDRLQARAESIAASTRSTVTLDDRFAARHADSDTRANNNLLLPLPTPAANTATPTGNTAQGGELAGQMGGQDQQGGASAGQDPSGQQTSPDEGAQWAAEKRAQIEERLDAFASTTLREAKLRVGESGSDAIDIQLSLNGQSLDLGFRTDSAEARAALAHHTQDSLGEMLQRSGIQLGDVSVGAQNDQGAGGSRQGAGHTTGRPSAPPVGRTAPADPVPAQPLATTRPPRSDGSRPLDMFI